MAIEEAHRFFGHVFCFFHLHRPPLCGWTAIARQVALTYAATWVIALVAYQSARPDLIRSPRRVLAHLWEGLGGMKCASSSRSVSHPVPLSLVARRMDGMRPGDLMQVDQTKPEEPRLY